MIISCTCGAARFVTGNWKITPGRDPMSTGLLVGVTQMRWWFQRQIRFG
jgi:hypothetical protein